MKNFILYTKHTAPENLMERVEGKEHDSEFTLNLMDFISECRSWLKSFQLPDNF